MAGFGFFLLVGIPGIGFLLALGMYCYKPVRFLAPYAFLVPAMGSWGSLIGILSDSSTLNVVFLGGGMLGAATGAGIAFGLSRWASHA